MPTPMKETLAASCKNVHIKPIVGLKMESFDLCSLINNSLLCSRNWSIAATHSTKENTIITTTTITNITNDNLKPVHVHVGEYSSRDRSTLYIHECRGVQQS